MMLLTDPLGRPIHAPDPDESAAEVLDLIARADIVAFDVETTGNTAAAVLRTVQLGTLEESVHLRAESPVHMDEVRRWFATTQMPLTAHNAGFDIGHLHRAGIADARRLWERTVDTLILDRLLRPGDGTTDPKHDLKNATRAWCGGAATSADAKAELMAWGRSLGLKTHARTYAECPIDGEPYILYGAADVFDSATLVRALLPLADAALGRDAVEREHRLASLIHRMLLRGMKIDAEAVQRDAPALYAQVAEMRDALTADYGIENPASQPQLLAWFTDRDVPIPNTRQAVLEELELDGEPAKFRDALLAWRAESKVLNTYVKALANAPADADGIPRFHPDLKALGARTGRMTCGAPNMQNVPKQLRGYVVAEPGHTLVAADFNAVEVRVAAGLAADERLTTAFLRGEDCYAAAATVAWGEPPTDEAEYKQWRNRAKPLLLGHIFGRGAKSVAGGIGTTVEDARERQRALDAAMPSVREFNLRTRAEVSMGKTIHRLPSGRVVQVHPLGYYTQSVNSRVQGGARDLLVAATVALDDAGFGDALWLPIHDEWILQVRDEDVPAAMEALNKAMSLTVGAVPIKADAEVMGKSWKKL